MRYCPECKEPLKKIMHPRFRFGEIDVDVTYDPEKIQHLADYERFRSLILKEGGSVSFLAYTLSCSKCGYTAAGP